MLDDIIANISKTLENLGTILEGYAPRFQQRKMIHEIIKTLTMPDNGYIVCEAGTGVGKSLAYLIASLPVALKLDKKIIISTATIALQEQLVNQDIPLFQKAYPTKFTYALAKGRSNYVCQGSLEELMDEIESFGGFEALSKDSELHIVKDLFEGIVNKAWDGERSTFKDQISDKIWNQIKSETHKCTKKNHPSCPFHSARDELTHCDIIVANHSLVISDLSLSDGGGLILPEASQSIYIFDEAHNLPRIARDSVSGSFNLSGNAELLVSIYKTMLRYDKVAQSNEQFKFVTPISNEILDLINPVNEILESLNEFYKINQELFVEEQYIARTLSKAESESYKSLINAAGKLRTKIKALSNKAAGLIEAKTGTKADESQANQIISDCTFYESRMDNLKAVSELMIEDTTKSLVAKWIDSVGGSFTVNASPVDSGKTLTKLLWDHADKVILTSATLTALGKFNLYRLEAGIPDDAKTLIQGSPFDYPNVAELYLPTDNNISPTNQDMFTKYLKAELFRQFISGQSASLVLFSSYWQMNDVTKELKEIAIENGYKIQCQGEMPKEVILKNHENYIKNNIPSILCGTGSFSEGLNLPRDLLTNVIITKIPFARPTDPVSIIHAESIEAQGRSSFKEISLPDASRHLIQASGRLIRTVEDKGRIIILDNRMTKSSYGKELLKHLPPFKVIYGNPK